MPFKDLLDRKWKKAVPSIKCLIALVSNEDENLSQRWISKHLNAQKNEKVTISNMEHISVVSTCTNSLIFLETSCVNEHVMLRLQKM